MTQQTNKYIKSVAVYAEANGLDFISAAKEYNALNNATFDHLFNIHSHLIAKESRKNAIRIIATEVYNRINGKN